MTAALSNKAEKNRREAFAEAIDLATRQAESMDQARDHAGEMARACSEKAMVETYRKTANYCRGGAQALRDLVTALRAKLTEDE